MNVLKADFMSKQKRLQGRRQKVIKTFYSGYHTVSNILPPTSGFKLPIISETNNSSQIKASPGLPSSFSCIRESVEPLSIDERFFGLDVGNRGDFFGRKESASSTSLEFQKILEPFLSFRQEYLPNTDEEGSEKNYDPESFDKFFQNFRGTREKSLDSIFHNEQGAEILQNLELNCKVTPIQSNINKSTFESYNIFNLPVPKNQKSIEEVLRTESAVSGEASEEVIQSLKNKVRNSGFIAKTPKTKARKSPKVSSSCKTVNSHSGSIILAVTEGRGHARGEVGMAAMDPKRPHLVLCQISDSQSYVHSLTKMNVFELIEVIVPSTFVDCTSPNKLYSEIRMTFPKVTLTSVQRRHFNESIGVDLIRQYSSPESSSVMVLIRDKFYALSAAAALLKYIEFTQNVRLAPRSLKIEYQGMEDTMIIDLNTANLLELVLCVNHPETNLNHSLLGVIKFCHTKGGVRLLRANILQPPCSLGKIETRLDCVTELVENPLLLCSLEAAVSSFSNLEDLLNLCMHAPKQDGLRVAEHQLKYTLLLKTMLELLPSLLRSLQDASSPFFCQVRKRLEEPRYSTILERILQTVFENAKTVKGSVAAHLHGCFAIKTGINSLLDVAKKTYCEIIQEISDHVTKLREKHNMPLRLAFSANKGFHIQYTLPPGQRSLTGASLPKEFILAHKSKTTFSFYTTELVVLDQRSQHVLNEIKLMTNVILFELLTDIRQDIGCLYNLCECIAELDVLVSFAHVGSGTNYVRPQFGDELDLKASRHPILNVIYDGEVVPNDVFAKTGKNFTILTGPNQSGKSIYIRQIALLQIMAQIGCYVPAKEANFRVTDRIFSRIGFDDSIESNASTLIVEMRDIEYLRQNKTPRSLVIIDELCRGTSVEEGTSLAFTICEELLDTSTFIFFTTHYLFLTKLEEMYFNVTNYHFGSKIEINQGRKPSIRFTHLRNSGATEADSYGLQVAELTSFPKDVYQKAKDISLRLSKDRKPSRKVNGLLAKYELSLRLRTELLKLNSEANWQDMEPVIRNFRASYTNLKNEEQLLTNKSVSQSQMDSGEENNCLNISKNEYSSGTTGKLEGSRASIRFIDVRSGKTTRGSRKPRCVDNVNEGNDETVNVNTIKLATAIKKKYRRFLFKKAFLNRRRHLTRKLRESRVIKMHRKNTYIFKN